MFSCRRKEENLARQRAAEKAAGEEKVRIVGGDEQAGLPAAPSFFWCLFLIVKTNFLLAILFRASLDTLQFVQPQILK